MKNKTFRQIFTDGVALLLPILVALYLAKKILEEVRKVITPIADKLGLEHFLGRFTLTILSLAVLFLLTLLFGLMMEWRIVVSFRNAFEKIMLRLFPPMNQLKVILSDVLDRENATKGWKSVLLQEGENYRFAFLVEETDIMGVFFIMKSQSVHDGDVEMLKKDTYSYIEVDASDMKKSMREFGVNASALTTKTNRSN